MVGTAREEGAVLDDDAVLDDGAVLDDDAATSSLGVAPRVGIVLGAGAAWGAAHVGVLQVLDEEGIAISVIVGSSAGAVIGAGYAGGLTASELAERLPNVRWSSFADWHPSRRWTLFDSSPVDRVVAEGGPVDIEDLNVAFGVLAFDVRQREPVLLRSGPLATALRASIAIPGLLPPIRVDGRILVDGSLGDRDAVRAAHALGAERVIAVRLDSEPGPDASAAARLLDTVSGARRARIRDTRAAVAPADVLIRPRTQGMSRWTSRDVPRLIAAGRVATEAALPQIRDLMSTFPL